MMPDSEGKPLRLDPNAASASHELPAFLARPAGAPVYHGFPIIAETMTDGWVFGTITDYQDPKGCTEGDAFVVAPDGTRAGIVWQMGNVSDVEEIRPPDEERWGVYSIDFPKAIFTTDDFVQCCRTVLPHLKRIHATVMKSS